MIKGKSRITSINGYVRKQFRESKKEKMMIRKQTIINAEINYMLGSMGHSDILLITDAGFPIPKDAWLIDLAITRDFPDLISVLDIIGKEFIAEKIIYADYVPSHNSPLNKELKRIFSDCEHELIPHEMMMTEIRDNAKGFIRTGGICLWGNIALISGIDVDIWFSKPDTSMPAAYKEQFNHIRKTK